MIRSLVLAVVMVLVAACGTSPPINLSDGSVKALDDHALDLVCAQFWATKSRAHGQLGVLTTREIGRLQEINISGTVSCSEPQADPGATSIAVMGYIEEMMAMMGQST